MALVVLATTAAACAEPASLRVTHALGAEAPAAADHAYVLVALAVALGAAACALAEVPRLRPLARLAWLALACAVAARGIALAPAVEPEGWPPLGPVLRAALAVLAILPCTRLALGGTRPGGVAALAVTILVGLEIGFGIRQGREPIVARSAHPLLAIAPEGSFAWGGTKDLRGLEVSPEPAPGVVRVFVVGGSSAYGHTMPAREGTFVERLEARLTGRLGPGRRAEVICGAARGYTSAQELAVLVAHGIRLRPAIVVALDGYNDVMILSPRGRAPGETWFWPQQRLYVDNPLLVGLADASLVARRLLKKQAVLPFTMAYWRVLGQPANDRYAADFARNLDAMARVARDAGARFAWSFVPLVHDRAPLAPSEASAAAVDPPSLGEELHRRVALCKRLGADAVRAGGGTVIDAPALLAEAAKADVGKTAWFVDDCHYTVEGNDLLGRLVAAALGDAGLLDAPGGGGR